MRDIEIPSPKATAQLVGKDGNAFAVMGRAIQGMRRAGYSATLIEQYQREAMSADYDRLLAVTMDYVDDESEDDTMFNEEQADEDRYANGPYGDEW